MNAHVEAGLVMTEEERSSRGIKNPDCILAKDEYCRKYRNFKSVEEALKIWDEEFKNQPEVKRFLWCESL